MSLPHEGIDGSSTRPLQLMKPHVCCAQPHMTQHSSSCMFLPIKPTNQEAPELHQIMQNSQPQCAPVALPAPSPFSGSPGALMTGEWWHWPQLDKCNHASRM